MKALKPVYTAPCETKDRFEEITAERGQRYPAIVQLWRAAWAQFVPFLQYDARDPAGDLHDQRDRTDQREVSPSGSGARALPERAGSTEVPVLGDALP